MDFKPTYQAAIKRKKEFLSLGLREYSNSRNYDYGPNKRHNVSGLSPYVNNGLIDIADLAQECIDLYGERNVDKYVSELFWGVYWKGYLELRPTIWTSFKNDLENLSDYKKSESYKKAVNGLTCISCFNEWVDELKKYNYLHNHTRMWFASIWIFTLKLPWQLGAAFFLEYLYDGDVASNTLSWRWVAGLHTKNKAYFASAENIQKYSSKTVSQHLLNLDCYVPKEEKNHEVIPLDLEPLNNENYEILIVFDSSLGIKDLSCHAKNFKEIYFVISDNKHRSLKLDKKVINFKRKLGEDFINRVANQYDIKTIELENLDDRFIGSSAIYPNVGDICDYVKGLSLKYIYSKLDILSIPKCDAGYFKFKKSIHSFIEKGESHV